MCLCWCHPHRAVVAPHLLPYHSLSSRLAGACLVSPRRTSPFGAMAPNGYHSGIICGATETPRGGLQSQMPAAADGCRWPLPGGCRLQSAVRWLPADGCYSNFTGTPISIFIGTAYSSFIGMAANCCLAAAARGRCMIDAGCCPGATARCLFPPLCRPLALLQPPCRAPQAFSLELLRITVGRRAARGSDDAVRPQASAGGALPATEWEQEAAGPH